MRALRIAMTIALSAALAGACVDLFHSTDFVTLCAADPSACSDGSPPEAAVPDAPEAPLVTEYCGWSPNEARAHAERACAWLGACGGVLEEGRFGACMVRALAAYDCKLNPSLRPRGATNILWSCLAVVDSCAKVDRCVHGLGAPTCPSGGPLTICSGTSVVACSKTGTAVGLEPCALEGRSCLTADAATSFCAGKQGITCSSASRCEGTSAVECRVTTVATDVGVDCAAYGDGRCVDGDGGAACAPLEDAGSCSGPALVACDDAGVARSCVAGREVRIDCTELSNGCSAAPTLAQSNPLGACTNTDAATRCSGPDVCDGDVLRSCAQGQSFEVSCARLRLGPCAVPPDRGPVATCTRPPER